MPRSDSASGARVADLGELAVLDRIARRVGPSPAHVVVGIGDDTAVLRPTPGALVLMTTDALVEDVHFRRATSSAADVGWKALAVNASDIASMGGVPTSAVVSLMLPPSLEAEWVDGLYDGLVEAAGVFGVAIVGGNLAQAQAIVVDVTVLGEVAPEHLVRRSGARPGDLIVVTGTLGRAAAGLIALERGAAAVHEVQAAIAAQRRPRPRLAAGRALGATGVLHAMIDLSDGLALDLARVCDASGVGARIDAGRLPIDGAALAAARDFGVDSLDLSLAGGEDYELLFIVAPADADRATAALAGAGEIGATVVGAVVDEQAGRTIVVDGTARRLDARGWRHFRRDRGDDDR